MGFPTYGSRTLLKIFVTLTSVLHCVHSSRTVDYLESISGDLTVAGIHNRNSVLPAEFTCEAREISGLKPGLWSGDFLFEPEHINARWTMINEAQAQWESGSLINIMWHACNPALSEPCYWEEGSGPRSNLSDRQWRELTTDGTALNSRWKAMMDDVAQYLLFLQDKGVEVMFRPLHEMNQGAFWWGGRAGSEGTLKLYQLTHDYFVQDKGLSSLIWVWNMQDFGGLVNDLRNYNPGSNYWDIATLDVYEGFQGWKYQAMVDVSGGKPIGIGECSTLPDANRLANEPLWTFFMSWSELTFEDNSNQQISDLYNSNRVVTHDELPFSGGGLARGRPVLASSTEQGSGNNPEHAVDGDGCSRWSSSYNNNEWIRVDLGSKQNIARVVLHWEAAYARSYSIQVSDDDSSWATVFSTSNGDGGVDVILLENQSGRYVRMNGILRVTEFGFSLWDFTVQATVAPPSEAVVSIQSAHGTYLSGWDDGGVRLQQSVQGWERWTKVPMTSGRIALRSFHGTYLSAWDDGRVVTAPHAQGWEEWTQVQNGDGSVSFCSHRGTYLSAWPDGSVRQASHNRGWERFRYL
jgi:mannan endo-1,4-beta-mannosidase